MGDNILFYDAAGNTGEFYETRNGLADMIHSNTDWLSTWKLIVSGNFFQTGYTDLLFYDAPAGTGAFFSAINGEMSQEAVFPGWRTTWTHIIPGIYRSFPPSFHPVFLPDLLFYDSSAGLVEVYAGHGGFQRLTSTTGWRTTWTHIVTGNFGGKGSTDVLFYDAAAGTGEFYTVNNGALTLLQTVTGWRSDWTHIIRGSFGGSGTSDLLFYEAASGTGEFYTVNNGSISLIRSNTGWRTSWTSILPGNFSTNQTISQTNLLFYDAAAGVGEFYSVNKGVLNLMQSRSDWRTSWTHIVPGIYLLVDVPFNAKGGYRGTWSSDDGGAGDDN